MPYPVFAVSPTLSLTFGHLLKQLRKRAGITQAELGTLVGLSLAHISHLEKNQRLPDIKAVMEKFIVALDLQDDPRTAIHLIELAAATRGEKPPTSITLTRETRQIITEEIDHYQLRLPIQPTQLIGRDTEINILVKRLLNHPGRLLTLVGPPGVGKTRLGLAVATQLQLLFADGVHFVPLAALTEPELVAPSLLTVLGVPESPHNSKPPKLRLIEFLRRQHVLLLLDNFEQILAASALLADLLAECPQVYLLVTSRERLHLRAEQRYRVPPLTLASAVKLFVQCAQTSEPTFMATDAIIPILETICTRLDCLPLAIELVAARSDLFAPQTMLARLQNQRLDLLNDGYQDLPVHQQTLRNAIHRSYKLLTEREQLLFRTLGVFAGDFDLAAIMHFGFTEAEVQVLVYKNLVRSEGQAVDKSRFSLLETLREYALEQLAQAHEVETAQRIHALYFFELVRKFDIMIEEADIDSVLQIERTIEREVNNLRVALHWVIAHEPIRELPFLNYLFSVLHSGYYLNEGYRWIEAALPRSKAELTLDYARFLHTVAFMRLRQGNLDEAQTYTEEGLTLYRKLADLSGQVLLLNLLAEILKNHSDYPGVRVVVEESVAIARIVGKPALLAVTLYGFWETLIERDDQATARTILHEIVSLWHSLDHPLCRALTADVLAKDAFLRGELSRARAQGEEALQLYQSVNATWHGAWTLLRLGQIAWRQGDKVQARVLFEKCLTWARTLPIQTFLRDSLLLSGLTAQEQNEQLRARALLTECLTLAQENNFLQYKGNQAFIAYLLSGLAGLLRSPEQAAQLLSLVSRLLDRAYGLLYFVVHHAHYKRILTTVRAQLDEVAFSVAWEAGQIMTVDEAISYTLVALKT